MAFGWHTHRAGWPIFIHVIRQAAAAFSQAADVSGHPKHTYKKHNVLYVAKSNVLLRSGLQRHRALSLVVDEAAFVNGAILQVFASTPTTADVAVGSVLPPQMLPDLHVCLSDKKVMARIQEFCPAGVAEVGEKPRQGNAVPKGDELIPSWHAMVAVDNALRMTLLSDGLAYFFGKCGAVGSPTAARAVPSRGVVFDVRPRALPDGSAHDPLLADESSLVPRPMPH